MCDIAGESRASYGTVAASVMRNIESLICSPEHRPPGIGHRSTDPATGLLAELINPSNFVSSGIAATSLVTAAASVCLDVEHAPHEN